jgi:hypothetical protein
LLADERGGRGLADPQPAPPSEPIDVRFGYVACVRLRADASLEMVSVALLRPQWR